MDGATFSSAPATPGAAAEPPARLNRRQAAKLRTRQRVLAAATDLFKDVGYAKGTIRAIAKKAALPPPPPAPAPATGGADA